VEHSADMLTYFTSQSRIWSVTSQIWISVCIYVASEVDFIF
jgi:hypothetical protein